MQEYEWTEEGICTQIFIWGNVEFYTYFISLLLLTWQQCWRLCGHMNANHSHIFCVKKTNIFWENICLTFEVRTTRYWKNERENERKKERPGMWLSQRSVSGWTLAVASLAWHTTGRFHGDSGTSEGRCGLLPSDDRRRLMVSEPWKLNLYSTNTCCPCVFGYQLLVLAPCSYFTLSIRDAS